MDPLYQYGRRIREYADRKPLELGFATNSKEDALAYCRVQVRTSWVYESNCDGKYLFRRSQDGREAGPWTRDREPAQWTKIKSDAAKLASAPDGTTLVSLGLDYERVVRLSQMRAVGRLFWKQRSDDVQPFIVQLERLKKGWVVRRG